MAKADRASEPSMDEILASIRKIIAEEPAGTRKAGEAGAADGTVNRSPGASRVSLDDILGMADSKPVLERPNEARGTEASWPFAEAAPGSSKAAPERAPENAKRPAVPGPGSGRLQGTFDDNGRGTAANGAMAAPQRPLDIGTIVPRRPADAANEAKSGRLPDWLSRPTPLGPAVPSDVPPPALPTEAGLMSAGNPSTSGPDARRAGDNNAVIAPPPPPTVASTSGRESSSAAPNRAGSADATSGSTSGMVPDAPQTPPARSAGLPPLRQDRAVDTPSEMVAGTTGASVAPAVSGGFTLGSLRSGEDRAGAATAHAAKAAPASPQERAAAAAATVSAGPAGATKTAAQAAPVVSSGHQGYGGTGAVLSGRPAASDVVEDKPVATFSGEPSAGAQSSPADVPGETAAIAPLPIAEPSIALTKPAVMVDKSKVAKVSATELVSGVAGSGVRTLDDTIIELLRPMIRQWLDDNMPRMVEKALRIEMAASLQAKTGEGTRGDPSKH